MSSAHQSDCDAKVRQLERRLAALQDLGLDVAVIQSQVSFVRDLVAEGRYRDGLALAEDLLGMAEQVAKGRQDRKDLTRAVRATSRQYYDRQHTMGDIKDVLESGLLQRMLAKQLRSGSKNGESSDHNELVEAFQSGLRRALKAMPESKESMTDRIDASVAAHVAKARDDFEAQPPPSPVGSVDIDELARQVAADIGGPGNPVHEELLNRLRSSLGQHVNTIEQRMSDQMSEIQGRLDQLAEVISAGAAIEHLSSSRRQTTGTHAEEFDDVPGVEVDDKPQVTSPAKPTSKGIPSDTQMQAQRKARKEARQQSKIQSEIFAAEVAAAMVDEGIISETTDETGEIGEISEIGEIDVAADDASAPDSEEISAVHSATDMMAVFEQAASGPRPAVDPSTSQSVDRVPAAEDAVGQDADEPAEDAAVAEDSWATGSQPSTLTPDQADQLVASSPALSAMNQIPDAAIETAIAEAAEAADVSSVPETSDSPSGDEALGDQPGMSVQDEIDRIMREAEQELEQRGATEDQEDSVAADLAPPEDAPSGPDTDIDHGDQDVNRVSNMMQSTDQKTGYEPEDTFILEVSRMLGDSNYEPAPPPSRELPIPQGGNDNATADAGQHQPQREESGTRRMAAASAGVGLDREAVIQLLRSVLPELLKEEEIKQHLFAMITTEAVVNPGVLGDLTGFRRFLAKEVERAVQQSNGVALP